MTSGEPNNVLHIAGVDETDGPSELDALALLVPRWHHLRGHLSLHRRSAGLRRMGVRRGQGHLLLERVHHLPVLHALRDVSRHLSLRLLHLVQQP